MMRPRKMKRLICLLMLSVGLLSVSVSCKPVSTFVSNNPNAPVSALEQGSQNKSNTPSAPPQISTSEADQVQAKLEELPKGLFFYNIPKEMRVGQAFIVEAGIAKTYPDVIKQKLKGSGVVIATEDVPYDKQSVDFEIEADSNVFKVVGILTGRRSPFVDGQSTLWRWEVIPYRSGQEFLTLKSSINITKTDSRQGYSRDYLESKEPIYIQENISYSIVNFMSNYWFNSSIFIACFCFGIVLWVKAIRQSKLIKKGNIS
jgi:hypothetical protein